MASTRYASPSRPARITTDEDSGSSAFFAVVSLLLGILVGILGLVAILMWADTARPRSPPRPEAHRARWPEWTWDATATTAGA